ncbi:RagB/SusD family nutrient uptake outer membrane protein [Pedobacter sp. MC2016-05]|uniref:RagB/SusD family nutrient uptake outer membrane protein n=1 Tax=Pedobacter sp. MC2016-05 TaxID=2994474 RepID=UPI0022458337|nr:RagB/SusD family nutrient uptake outer membrane protein [Pedobacter sp. MC2016-05]MCX2475305.1 RagB/SusD family nutrient uptake outer membrane protein [Pedobacter sp. MC2016-05]
MKKYKYIYLMMATLLVFSSCKRDEFLNRIPLSDISPENFFKNENDLQLYCNQYYSSLPVQNLVRADNNSDDKANSSINTLLNGTLNVNSAASLWDFSLNRRCNFFLANYSKAAIPEATKNIYVGETLFFRSNDFFNKVKDFGDVPYISKYVTDTTTSVLFGSRMPHKQIMDSVLRDINFAIASLPVAPSNGRIGKYAALALKARICLWEGTWRKYTGAGNEEVYLRQAVTAAEEIMNSGLYRLYSTGNPRTDYYNLFIQEELQNNPEAILPMRYLPTILMNGVSRSIGEASDGYSKDFVRSFLCIDGLPTSLSPLYRGDNSLDDEVQNRDPRFPQQIATRGFDFLAGDLITLPRIGTSVTSTGYQPIKGRSSSLAAWNANQSSLDFFIFRYAEILLIEAEAKAELGEATQTVIDNTINKLRARVGMPNLVISALVKDPKSVFPTLPVLLDEIRRERRIELGSSGLRLDDLRRWRAGTLINNPETILGMKLLPALRAQYPASQVNGIVVNADFYIRVYPNIAARTWNDKNYLYPIPQTQLNLNPNLKQNPGW